MNMLKFKVYVRQSENIPKTVQIKLGLFIFVTRKKCWLVMEDLLFYLSF